MMKFCATFHTTAFLTAVEHNNLEIVKLLLSKQNLDVSCLLIINSISNRIPNLILLILLLIKSFKYSF